MCPYHAWSYRLDGSLIGAPHFSEVESSTRPRWASSRCGWSSGRAGSSSTGLGTATDLAEHIGELEEIVGPYDAASLVTCETHEYDVAANWKVIVENYQECYHCSMIHPELCRVSPPDSGENLEQDGNWVGGWMELRDGAETMSLDGRSGGVAMARLDEHERSTVMYVAVLPNLLISLHPDYVMTHQLVPLSPGSTRITCSWSFPPDVAARDDFDPAYAVDFWDLTNRQDWSACESVQRGMQAPRLRAGSARPRRGRRLPLRHPPRAGLPRDLSSGQGARVTPSCAGLPIAWRQRRRRSGLLRPAHQRHPAVTTRAPTRDPMIPLGLRSRPSPDSRLINNPPMNEPASPATIAIVQSIEPWDRPRISCAPAPTSMPNRMMAMMSMPRD